MPGTIKETYQRYTTFGDFKNTINPGTASLSQTTKALSEQIATASSDIAEVTLTGIASTSHGRGYWACMDDSNYVDVYASTAGSTTVIPMFRAMPTEFNSFRSYPGNRWWIQSSTGTPQVHISILQD